MTESIVCAADLERYAAKHATYVGRDYTSVGGHFQVDSGGGTRVTVVSPRRVAEIVPRGAAPTEPSPIEFTVAVDHVDRASEILKRNGVPFERCMDRIVVAAGNACGSAVLFETWDRSLSRGSSRARL